MDSRSVRCKIHPCLISHPVFWVNVHILTISIFISTRGLEQQLEPAGRPGLCLLWVRLCHRHPADGQAATRRQRTTAPAHQEAPKNHRSHQRPKDPDLFQYHRYFLVWLLTFACVGYYLHNDHIMCLLFWIPAVISSQSFKLCPFPQQASLCPYRGTTQ